MTALRRLELAQLLYFLENCALLSQIIIKFAEISDVFNVLLIAN